MVVTDMDILRYLRRLGSSLVRLNEERASAVDSARLQPSQEPSEDRKGIRIIRSMATNLSSFILLAHGTIGDPLFRNKGTD